MKPYTKLEALILGNGFSILASVTLRLGITMASEFNKFVKLHSLTSSTGLTLNGTTGRLGAWHKNFNGQVGNNRYEVFVGSPQRVFMIKLENMYAVEPRWIEEVRGSPMKNRMYDMMSKFNAPGVYPCRIGDLQVLPRHFGGPCINRELLQSWWGDNVFRFIRERMEGQKMLKGVANRDMYRAIEEGTLMIAGVRSDGGHAMQENPTADPAGFVIVWPTIVYPCSSPRNNCEYWSYCQGLALMDRASAWACSRGALDLYGSYQLIVEVPIDISQIPSTVQIRELESDEEVESNEELESDPFFDIEEGVYVF